ncbi:hypothetical protein Efla_004269 [Eimeria flavescens]
MRTPISADLAAGLVLGMFLAVWGAFAMVPPYNDSVSDVNCLREFNEARLKVGLTEMTKPRHNVLFQAEAQDMLMDMACEALKSGKVPSSQEGLEGTIMITAQDGKKVDCTAAARYFERGLSYFCRLPPKYTPGAEPYNHPQAMGFVGLYNPANTPEISCGYYTCHSYARDADEIPNRMDRGLFCITKPALKTGEHPLTQDLYDKIKRAFDRTGGQEGLFIRLLRLLFGRRNFFCPRDLWICKEQQEGCFTSNFLAAATTAAADVGRKWGTSFGGRGESCHLMVVVLGDCCFHGETE